VTENVRIDGRQLGEDPKLLRKAFAVLSIYGFVVLDNVLPAEKVEALSREFDATHQEYLEDQERPDSARVGNRRYMVPVALAGGFGEPSVYANPAVVSVVREALGHDAVLESFGAIVSLPGAGRQHIHRDSPFLFDSDIGPLLPAHALTFVLPLVEMNDMTGTTEFQAGSHLTGTREEGGEMHAPRVPLGSCILWDYRIHHGGAPNLSEGHRPILYCTYARPWYSDPVNYPKATQRRLIYDGDFLSGVADENRSLFAHVA
jgi:hypothetical protein